MFQNLNKHSPRRRIRRSGFRSVGEILAEFLAIPEYGSAIKRVGESYRLFGMKVLCLLDTQQGTQPLHSLGRGRYKVPDTFFATYIP